MIIGVQKNQFQNFYHFVRRWNSSDFAFENNPILLCRNIGKIEKYPMSYLRNNMSLSTWEVYYYKADAQFTINLGQFSTLNRFIK